MMKTRGHLENIPRTHKANKTNSLKWPLLEHDVLRWVDQ